MKRTIAQNKHLHGIAGRLGIDADTLKTLASSFSGNRTNRTSQLTIDECNNLIGCLQAELDGAQNLQKTLAKADADRRNGLRRKLIAVVYSLPEKLGFYETKNNKKHFSGSVFDDFLMNNPRSPFVGRKLNELGVNELTKLMAIMKKWVDFYNKKA